MPKKAKEKDTKTEKTTTEEKEFRIEQLFGSKTRVRLLRLLLENMDRAYYVREITRRIDAQLNSVRRELQNLVDLGLVNEVEGNILEEEKSEKKEKKASSVKKYYSCNVEFPFVDELRSIMSKSAIMMNKPFVESLKKSGRIDVLFLTGRFTDASGIASDILIVGEIKEEDLQAAIKEFESELGREINYTYMPREEFDYRKEVKDRFLESLLHAEKMILVNATDKHL